LAVCYDDEVTNDEAELVTDRFCNNALHLATLYLIPLTSEVGSGRLHVILISSCPWNEADRTDAYLC
jgi:hypothetical protein